MRRDDGPASVHRLVVSPISLCLFEFRFALVWLLVFIWTTDLTVEVQAQDVAGDQMAPMKKKVPVPVVNDRSKAQ